MTSNNELATYKTAEQTAAAFTGNAALVLGHRCEDFGVTSHSLFHGIFCCLTHLKT